MSDNDETQPRTQAPPAAAKPPSMAISSAVKPQEHDLHPIVAAAAGLTPTATPGVSSSSSSSTLRQRRSGSADKRRGAAKTLSSLDDYASIVSHESQSPMFCGQIPPASFFLEGKASALAAAKAARKNGEEQRTPVSSSEAAAAASPATTTTTTTTPRGSALRRPSMDSKPAVLTASSPYRPPPPAQADTDVALTFSHGSTRKRHEPSHTISPLQRSLDALRRKQAVRMALEEGVSDDDASGSASPDYWAPSPIRGLNSKPMIAPGLDIPAASSFSSSSRNQASSQQRRRPTSDSDEEDGEKRQKKKEQTAAFSPLRSSSLLQRLRAFTSAQDFGEELVMNVIGAIGQSLIAALWSLLLRFGAWLYRVVYYILFSAIPPNPAGGAAAPSASGHSADRIAADAAARRQNIHQGNGYPSPFPSFYRDAFFSTWSPHELLEPATLPMISAFAPSPLPRHLVDAAKSGNGATVAEMLRPTPAPPFWWLSLMEISGRHYIDTNWASQFSNLMVAATLESRRFWAVHEAEVRRGHDLVRRVVAGGDDESNGGRRAGMQNRSNSGGLHAARTQSPPPPFIAAAEANLASPNSEWSRQRYHHQADATPRTAAFKDMLRGV